MRFDPTLEKVKYKRGKSKPKGKGSKKKKRTKRFYWVAKSVIFPDGRTVRFGTNKKNYYFINDPKRGGRNRLAQRRISGKKRSDKNHLYLGGFPLANWLGTDRKAINKTAKLYGPKFFTNFTRRLNTSLRAKASKIKAKLIIKGAKF